jgi:hypothetical protein
VASPVTSVYAAPLWVLGLIIFLLLSGVAQLGAWLRQRRRATEEDDRSEGHLLSATLALLGLLIGFTFSLALSRYDARRAMVVTEANAIGTAWLRAGLAEGEAGPRLQSAVARYADVRFRLPDQGETRSVEAATGREQAALWREMREAIKETSRPVAATIVTATNAMFDAASERKAERNARIPSRVLAVVVLFATLSAGIVGYVLGGNRRHHRIVTAILFLLLTVTILLIVDLDRPWTGGITISQQPMVDARAAMH